MLLSLFALHASLASARPPVHTEAIDHLNQRYAVATVDPREARLELVGQAPGDPNSLERALELPDALLVTNAGMYHAFTWADRTPVGLHVQVDRTWRPVVRGARMGNFGLQPNGVFWLDDAGAHVVATEDWSEALPDGPVALATQSGPMLVREGALHPAFRPDSTSLKQRSGVGVRQDGTVVFALSVDPVRFHDFATLFRDVLDCDDALFLDGTISGIHTPDAKVGATERTYGGVLVVRRLAETRTPR